MARSAAWFLVGILLGMALTPTGRAATPAPVALVTATATEFSLWSVHTPAATATASITPSPTPAPTQTPAPTSTPSLTPPPTPTLTPFLIVMENGQYGPVVVTAPPGYVLPAATETPFVDLLPRPLPSEHLILPAAIVDATAIPVATAAAPQRSQPAISVSDCDCSGDSFKCDDFSSHDQAQACYQHCLNSVGSDIHRLDGNDNDGLACETLP